MELLAPLLTLAGVLLFTALLHGTTTAAQRSALRRRWRGVEETLQLEAVVAYKTAQVFVRDDGGEACLVGITSAMPYPVHAGAVCPRRGCTPPGLECRCGFYAFKQREDAVALLQETLPYNGLRHKALLTVSLEGAVLQYERGYRAERQTVHAVWFSRTCSRCSDAGVRRPADILAAATSHRTPQLDRLQARLRTDRRQVAKPLRAVCRDHVPAEDGALTLTLADLAGMLGTEVRWLDEAHPTASAGA